MSHGPVSNPSPQKFVEAKAQPVRREQMQEQINQFTGKLDQLQRRENEQSRSSEKKPEKQLRNKGEYTLQSSLARSVKQKPRDEQDAKSENGFGGVMVAILGGKAKVPVAQSAPAEPPPAHLDRIAAAIAELSGKNVDLRFQLNLPFGSARVDSALIGRDQLGRLTIHLGSNAVLPPDAMAKMASELARRLKGRKLRVGDVGFVESEKLVQQKLPR
jgi:hypothetical protein